MISKTWSWQATLVKSLSFKIPLPLEYVTHFVTRLLALGRLQRIVLPAPTQKYAAFYQPALNYCACALGRCYSSTQIAVTTSKPIFGYLLDTYHDGKLQLRDWPTAVPCMRARIPDLLPLFLFFTLNLSAWPSSFQGTRSSKMATHFVSTYRIQKCVAQINVLDLPYQYRTHISAARYECDCGIFSQTANSFKSYFFFTFETLVAWESRPNLYKLCLLHKKFQSLEMF